MKYILGIDTSNYTTSAALCDENGEVVLNRKMPLAVREGERGLRQSDAVFEHTRNMPEVIQEISGYSIAGVGYSASPRDVSGSYMPCFLCGKAAASCIAAALGVPAYSFSHQRGHVRAALYSTGRGELMDGRYAAFHVSGGTTEILSIDRGEISVIGGTLDLNAGQAIDRAGVRMGMKFPCGAELERIAAPASTRRPKISVNGLSCNFSGLENLVEHMIKEGISAEQNAAYVIEFVADTLDKLCENLRAQYPDIPVIFAGGVTSNRRIASRLGAKYGASFAAPEFSSDNASGTALLAYDRFIKEGRSFG